eukprot:gnl/Chilomastix_cuspidata/3109.p1 GENE.gnl/Chilomastix_cuspidata/3109~~gnl/Chilomastix_cuspidata/3109.p1  ORF type:complete len:2315 (+),score=318.82 gnl/Chilomastix_cuspidata/3109:762-6947(+)
MLEPLRTIAFVSSLRSGLLRESALELSGHFAAAPDGTDTPLNELWDIYRAVAATVIWDVLPQYIFETFHQQPTQVRELIENFFLSQWVLGMFGVTPVSAPKFPNASKHPLWEVLEHMLVSAVALFSSEEICASSQRTGEASEVKTYFSFFPVSVKHFFHWLKASNPRTPPPLQLPALVQMLKNDRLKKNAAQYLSLYCDLSSVAVNEFLMFSPEEDVKMLLFSTDLETRHRAVFLLAKIVSAHPTSARRLLAAPARAAPAYTSSYQHMNPIFQLREIVGAPNTPPDERFLSLYLLAVASYSNSVASLFAPFNGGATLHEVLLVLLTSNYAVVRLWACAVLARLCVVSGDTRVQLIDLAVDEKIKVLLQDQSPEVRAACILFATEFLLPKEFAVPSANLGKDATPDASTEGPKVTEAWSKRFLSIVGNIFGMSFDPSPLVRAEFLLFLSRVLSAFREPFIGSVIKVTVFQNFISETAMTITPRPGEEAARSSTELEESISATFELSEDITMSTSDIATDRFLRAQGDRPLGSFLKVSRRIQKIVMTFPKSLPTTDQYSGILMQILTHLKFMSVDPVSSIALLASEILQGVNTLVWFYIAKLYPFSSIFFHNQNIPRVSRGVGGRGARGNSMETQAPASIGEISETHEIMFSSERTDRSDSNAFDIASGQRRLSHKFLYGMIPERSDQFPSPAIVPASNQTRGCSLPLSFLGGKIPKVTKNKFFEQLQERTDALAKASGKPPQRTRQDSRQSGIFSSAKSSALLNTKRTGHGLTISIPLLPHEIGLFLLATFPWLRVGAQGEIIGIDALTKPKPERGVTTGEEKHDSDSYSSLEASRENSPGPKMEVAPKTLPASTQFSHDKNSDPSTRSSCRTSTLSLNLDAIKHSASALDLPEWQATLSPLLCSLLTIDVGELIYVTLMALEIHEERINSIRSRLDEALSKVTSSILPLAMRVLDTPLITESILNCSSIQAHTIHTSIGTKSNHLKLFFEDQHTPGEPNHAVSAAKAKAEFPEPSSPHRISNQHLSSALSNQPLGIFLSPLPIGSEICKESFIKNPDAVSKKLKVFFGDTIKLAKDDRNFCICGNETCENCVTRMTRRAPLDMLDSGNTTPHILSGCSSPICAMPNDDLWGIKAQNSLSIARKMLESSQQLHCITQQMNKREKKETYVEETGGDRLKRFFRSKAKTQAKADAEKSPLEEYSNFIFEITSAVPPPFSFLERDGLCSKRTAQNLGLSRHGSFAFMKDRNSPISGTLTPIMPHTLTNPDEPRVSCAVLSRSLYHCCNLINDNLVHPYEIGEQLPLLFSDRKNKECKLSDPEVSSLGFRILSQKSFHGSVAMRPEAVRESKQMQTLERLERAVVVARKAKKAKTTRKKSRIIRNRSGASLAKPLGRSSPRTIGGQMSRHTRMGAPHARAKGLTRNVRQSELKPPAPSTFLKELQLQPSASSGGELKGGFAETLNGLPEQLSFIAMQSTINQKATEFAHDILNEPKRLIGLKSEESQFLISSTLRPTVQPDSEHLSSPSAHAFRHACGLSSAERGDIAAMALHQFRPLLVTVDALSTLRIHNYNTRERLSHYPKKKLEDTDVSSWPGPKMYEGHSSREFTASKSQVVSFCSLCAITKFASASNTSDRSYRHSARSALKYALRKRQDFSVEDIKLLNEHSPHSVLAAGCSDGFVRIFCNYDSERNCRLATAFHLSVPNAPGLFSDEPGNLVKGFWESWGGLNLKGRPVCESNSWDPFFSPLLLNSMSRLERFHLTTERAGQYLRIIDSMRLHPRFISTVESARDLTAAQPRRLPRLPRNNARQASACIRLLKGAEKSERLLFAMSSGKSITEFDLIGEQKVSTYEQYGIHPLAFDLEPRDSAYFFAGDEKGVIYRVDRRESSRFHVIHTVSSGAVASLHVLRRMPTYITVATAGGGHSLFDIRRSSGDHRWSTPIQRVRNTGTFLIGPTLPGPKRPAAFREVASSMLAPVSAIDVHPLTAIAAVGGTKAPEFTLVTPQAQELTTFTLSTSLAVWKNANLEHVSCLAWHPLHTTLAVAASATDAGFGGRSQVHMYAYA